MIQQDSDVYRVGPDEGEFCFRREEKTKMSMKVMENILMCPDEEEKRAEKRGNVGQKPEERKMIGWYLMEQQHED